MNKSGLARESSFKNILHNFISSCEGRDQGQDFSDWLADKLIQEVPDMSEETGRKLAREIIGGIDDYNKTLNELNDAIGAGQSKEEWFAERMGKAYAGMPFNNAGERFQQVEESLVTSNIQLMHEIDAEPADEINITETDQAGWNEYSVKDKVKKIGKQVELAGTAIVANVIKKKAERDEKVNIGDIVRETFQDGAIESKEVKAAVAGAVKVAAMKGLENRLPADTPTEMICDMAGVAVEGAEALYDVANGEGTISDALDKIGRAGVAAGCRYGASMLKGFLLRQAWGGLLVDLLGGLLDHMKTPKFAENVYIVVHDAAIATWEGIKETIGRKVNVVKSLVVS